VKKKLTIIALALVLALAIVVPALAASATPSHAATQAATTQHFVAVGIVKHVYRTAGAMSVRVDLGSLHVKRFIGATLTVRVADKARILVITDGIARLGSLKDAKAGDKVRLEGTLRSVSSNPVPVFVAQRVSVLEPIPTNKLANFGAGGPITAVDTTNGTLTFTINQASRALWASLGTPLKVVVNSATDLTLLKDGVRTPITLDQVTTGESVWAAGTIDRSQTTPVFTATEATVRPAPTPTATTK
jgi:hypothetical protein